MTKPTLGAEAPDFTLLTDTGESLTLNALRGRPVVLFFYPKDDTEACTTEACGFRDLFPVLHDVGAWVVGVSPDGVLSHTKFKKKYALPFPLVADTEHEVAERYGVWREKTMFGNRYMGIVRTTFLLDAEGRIAHVFEKVKASGHADEVARTLKTLGLARG